MTRKLYHTICLTLCLALFPHPGGIAQKGARFKLREGTDVVLKFAETISSKTSTEDDPVNLVLDEDLKVGEVVVARKGAKAVGRITLAEKAKFMGRAGELSMRLEYLKVGDSRIKLRGKKGKEGEGKEGTTIVLTVLLGPIGLIKKGKNVEVKEGTELRAFVDEDIDLPAESAPPQVGKGL